MIMKVILILILFLLLASWDIPRLIRNKKKRKDLLVYSFLMIIGLTLSILFAFQIYLPMWVQE
ncbi:hypothetical protein [Ammoniphilus sp. 3BR4]|uniref:hypothetical protein n=1 Tax=Ammoniphilus sp. 3BR4 TaxID=3158265 RepID=UPI003465926C